MLRKSLASAVVVLGTVLATGVAAATPPYALAIVDNVHRGPAAGAGTVNVTPGARAYIGSYTLAPGSSAGWRAQPGLSMLSVTSGTLRVVQAKGCKAREYTAPEVAVLPAGTIHISSAGSDPAQFVGYFDSLEKDAGQPLVEGRAAKSPTGCAAGTYQAASAGISATTMAQGPFAPYVQHEDKGHTALRAKVPDGADIMILKFTVAPGGSSGWYRHAPGLAILTKGKLATYAPGANGGCPKVEEYTAGQAISHVHHDLHLTLVPLGTEVVEFYIVYWGMGNNRTPQPGIVNFIEANDFTPLPPAGCTNL